MTAHPRLLTVPEVCAQLGCGRAFVYRNAASLGAVKMGAHMRFRQADIDAYLDRRRVAVKAEAPASAVPEPKPKTHLSLVGRGELNPITGKPWTAERRAGGGER